MGPHHPMSNRNILADTAGCSNSAITLYLVKNDVYTIYPDIRAAVFVQSHSVFLCSHTKLHNKIFGALPVAAAEGKVQHVWEKILKVNKW